MNTSITRTATAENVLIDCTGLLFVLVGPAGVGKNSIMQVVLDRVETLSQMPTATTRPMRITEQQGREHWFISLDTFQQMIAAQSLVEYQEVYPGKFYGTPRPQIEQALRVDHRLLIADIDVIGATKLRDAFAEHVILIFIEPPSLQTLNERLRARGHMSEEEIQTRLARAPLELQFASQCDYRVVNSDLTQSVQTVTGIVRGEAERHGC